MKTPRKKKIKNKKSKVHVKEKIEVRRLVYYQLFRFCLILKKSFSVKVHMVNLGPLEDF